MKRGITLVLSAFLLLFYMAIVLYVFFAVIHIDTLANFVSGMAFEIIGFCALACLILGNIFSKPLKTGFFVPLITVTIIYTIILDVINILLIATIGHVFFILLNFVLLFFYFMVSVPMYIMGKR